MGSAPVSKALRKEGLIALGRVEVLQGGRVLLQRLGPLPALEGGIPCFLGISHGPQPL